MVTAISNPVKLTATAAEELKKIKAEQGISDENGLRIGVKGGGCAGFSYLLGFDLPADNDQRFEQDGLVILVKPEHLIYLAGIEIDYTVGLENRGFVFQNPNATKTCGCGTSFSA
jgi:iron-sulfur cluster assembly protein